MVYWKVKSVNLGRTVSRGVDRTA